MSNRLTFSLASLILIFALAFAAMPVIAAEGGPTVTITEYSGKDNPNSTTGANYVKTRADYRLKFEFNKLVSGSIAEGHITVKTAPAKGKLLTTLGTDNNGFSNSDIVKVTTGAGANKVWVVAFDLDAIDRDYSEGYLSISLAADTVLGAAAGDPTENLGNQPGSAAFESFPKSTSYTLTASEDAAAKVELVAEGDNKGKIVANSTFNVKFTPTGSTGPYPTDIPDTQIRIKNADGAIVTGISASSTGASVGGVFTATITAGNAPVATPIFIGVNPNWADAMPVGGLRIPAAAAPDPTITKQPTAEINISSADGLTTMPRAFVINVTFTPGEKDDDSAVDVTPGEDFHMAVIKGTDSGDNEVTFTKIDSQVSKNSYRGVLQYNTLSIPPLTITLARTETANYKDTSDDTMDAMGTVGGVAATPVAFATGASIADQDYKAGTAITDLELPEADADTGVAPLTYSLTPEIGNGLAFDANTRTISGTPTAVAAAVEYTYTVTDSATPATKDKLMFSITVAAADALEQPTNVMVALNAAKNGYTVSWTAPTDTAGINGYYVQYVYNPTETEYVSGAGVTTLEINEKPTSLKVWATADTEDMDPSAPPVGVTPPSADLTGLPNKPTNNAPAFLPSAVIDDIPARVGIAIPAVELPEATDIDPGDNDKISYSISPQLPDGLIFNVDTRVLSGTPTEAKAQDTYSYTANDGTTPSAPLEFDITVAANNKAVFAPDTTIADVPAREGIAITAVTLPTATDDDGDPVTHSLTPALPAGLTLTDKTISGTPTTPAAAAQYTWTADDGVDDGKPLNSLSFNITVAADARPEFSDTIATISATVDTAIMPKILPKATDADGDKITYSLTPAPLPAGLTYNTTTRLLSGTPSAVAGPKIYTYTASTVGKDASLTFIIEVKAKPTTPTPGNNVPTFDGATIDTISGTVGTAIKPRILPEATDADAGDMITYTLKPTTLPAGLTYDTKTRLLSGTPSAVAEAKVYTYTASDTKDSAKLSFVIVVNAAPTVPPTVNNDPTFGGAEIAPIKGTVGTAITGRTLPEANDPDGDKIKYSIQGTLPAGLEFNSVTRYLSGTPTAAMASTTYLYVASDEKGGTAALNLALEVKAAPTTPVPPSVEDGDLAASYNPATGVTTIGSGATTATTQSSHTTIIAPNGFATIGASKLPDLEEFFEIGGTITLADNDTADDKNSRTVVMSEILWGLDFGAPATQQTKWQFIELYNTTGAAIDLTGWTLTFKDGNVLPASDIDQMSNRGRNGWDVDSGDTGKSGRVTGTVATDVTSAITPVNIVSMYRNINYDHVEKQVANRGELVKGIPGGNGKGAWKSSARRSAYNRWIYDSKRAEHFKATGILTASSVSGTPFRINEIGNDSGKDNDWVELHNVTDAEASLKNYQLSVVTAKGTDTQLFHFHDKDYKVGPKGYVVISTRHPRDTDLAAGKDVSIADDQEENKGASSLFVVRSVDLPDNGKFALILRNNHEGKHLGTGNQLVDVVATSQSAFGDIDRATSLWPLTATGGPHGNVIDGGDEVFKAGLVYQRNGGNGRGEKQFAVRGFTGVGYDRAAENSAVNGGTPGYDNGAIKEKIADLSNAEVSFSEIMLSLGDNRQNLPQWIEIYNSSMTQAAITNGWKLHVENTADVATALDAVLNLDGMIIPPNQTILIVTNTGRVSDPDHFPSNRVVNIWTTKKHRDALGMARRTDQVFSTTGLYLKLTDKDNKLVDEFGNLDGNRRTRDELDKTWKIPMNGTDDNRRSSLIRVYDAGVPIKGTMEDAWVLADETNLAFAISETYYGDPDDFGTPGFRAGGPLPVSLSKFRPERLDNGSIRIVWITESELNNAGFNILRSEKRDGEYKQINTKLIAGQGTTSERTTYTHVDTSAKPNVIYYYQIQDVSHDGKVQTLRLSRLKGNVSPDGKLTTTWGELKALQ